MSERRRVGQASPASRRPTGNCTWWVCAATQSGPTLRILLIGDASRPEFHEACAALHDMACVTRVADVESAIAALHKGPLAPHAIVLAQSYPGQFAAAAVDRVRAAVPLARLIALLGSWCEGEPRSGRPLPGTVRVYWHEAAVRFRRELPCWFDRESAWSLPITATDEERLLATIGASVGKGDSPVFARTKTGTVPCGLIAIWSRRRELGELLADTCRTAGYATACMHPRRPCRVQGAAAAIFDGDSLDAATMDEVKRFAGHVVARPTARLARCAADTGCSRGGEAGRHRAGQTVSER